MTESPQKMVYQWDSGKQLVLIRITDSDQAILSILYDKCIWLHSTFTYERLTEFTVGLSTFEGNQQNEYNWQADGEKQIYCDVSVLRHSDGVVNLIMSYEKVVSMSVSFSSSEFAEFLKGLREWKTKIALIRTRE